MSSPSVTDDVMRTNAFIGMWRAVIHLALADASDKSDKNALYQREAITWIERGGKDFYLVCEFAGYSPTYVREKFKQCTEKRLRGGRYKR